MGEMIAMIVPKKGEPRRITCLYGGNPLNREHCDILSCPYKSLPSRCLRVPTFESPPAPSGEKNGQTPLAESLLVLAFIHN